MIDFTKLTIPRGCRFRMDFYSEDDGSMEGDKVRMKLSYLDSDKHAVAYTTREAAQYTTINILQFVVDNLKRQIDLL